MDEGTKKIRKINLKTPLQARVGFFYKQKFYEIADKKHFDNKLLMEDMILKYIQQDRELKREENLSFKNEISIVTEAVNSLMGIFKTMAIKSQDTLNSKIDFYEQQIKNLQLQLETKDNELNVVIQDKNNIQTMNDKLVLENEKITEENKQLSDKGHKQSNDINDIKLKNAELLSHISQLSKYEKENKKLEGKLEKLNKEQSMLLDSVENVKKEHELNAKMQILDMQNKYNDLQIDYLKIKEELSKIKESKKGSIILK